MADFNLVGRIRPVYKGVWSIDNEYTVLETVINSVRHTAYIAIRDVPAGVELTNAEYWGILADVSDLHGVNGADGKDGGYIIPSVTATDDGYINFSFTPSDPDMDVIIMDKLIQLPAGPRGERGENGVGIESVTQSVVNFESGGINKFRITLTDGTSSEISIRNGERGERGEPGEEGMPGPCPDVQSFAIENGKELVFTNPSSGVEVGRTYVYNGRDGATGPKGDTGATGLQGEKGADGSPGPAGEAGIGIKSVTQTTTSSADGGSNVITVTKTDGSTSTFTVKNGSKGSKGDAGPQGSTGATGPQGPQGVKGDKGDTGPAGYTPVKGTDYFTDADQESVIQQVIAAIGTPVFGRVDENNNIILTGELADGTYTLKYEDADGNVTVIGTLKSESGPSYTNVLPLAIAADGTPYNGGQGWKTDTRLNSSGAESTSSATGVEVTGFISVKNGDVVYLSGITLNKAQSGANSYIWLYDSSFTKLNGRYTRLDDKDDATLASWKTSGIIDMDGDGNITKLTVGDNDLFRTGASFGDITTVAYLRFSCAEINADSIITVNEPIA